MKRSLFCTITMFLVIILSTACTKDCPLKHVQSHVIVKIGECHYGVFGPTVCKVLFEDGSTTSLDSPMVGEIVWIPKCVLTLEEK